ncbi:MAG TPA: hypothetical protein VJM08_07780, partial [Anaerolineales bacterium]|nr:hypothetical protein [Anaerolineales bacterium]
MAAIKKRSASLMEKRNNILPRSERMEDLLLEDQGAEGPNEILADMNDLESLVLMGEEVGDPDIGVLAQQKEELIDDVIDLKNPAVAAEF